MDVKSVIDQSAMTSLQLIVVLICCVLNMVDGMDVMVIAYVAPSLSQEWAIGPEALGGVFSAGVFGMTLGAVVLAPRADAIGRRPTILLCIVIITAGILATALASSVTHLVVLRFLSGLGIGAMLATVATLVAEYSPDSKRNFLVGFALAGYPIGATLSGLIAAQVVPEYGWRAMFLVAGGISALTLPLVFWWLPESITFLVRRRPVNALHHVNRILHRMRLHALASLPDDAQVASQAGVAALFAGERRRSTILLWLAFLMSFATLYFLISWIPKLASTTGLSVELAIYSGSVFNLGAAMGILTQGYLSLRFGLKRVIAGFLFATAALMGVFGYFHDAAWILLLFGLIGFGVQGGFTGVYCCRETLPDRTSFDRRWLGYWGRSCRCSHRTDTGWRINWPGYDDDRKFHDIYYSIACCRASDNRDQVGRR